MLFCLVTRHSLPKTNDGTVEMIRQIKVAKDVAVKEERRRSSA